MGLIALPHTIQAGQTALASEVQENFEAIVTVVNGGIQTVNITDNAVTQAKIASSAVGTNQIADGAVTAGKIATGAVTETKLDNSAVTANKLATNAVTTDKINTGAVTETKIANGAVTVDKMSAAALAQPLLTLFPGLDSAPRLYVVKSSGTVEIPTGWSVTHDNNGTYTVTHNFGSTNYLVLFEGLIGVTPHAVTEVVTKSSNYFTYRSQYITNSPYITGAVNCLVLRL